MPTAFQAKGSMKSNCWEQKLRIVGRKLSALIGTRLFQAGSKGPEEYQNKPATEDNSLCKKITQKRSATNPYQLSQG